MYVSVQFILLAFMISETLQSGRGGVALAKSYSDHVNAVLNKVFGVLYLNTLSFQISTVCAGEGLDPALLLC